MAQRSKVQLIVTEAAVEGGVTAEHQGTEGARSCFSLSERRKHHSREGRKLGLQAYLSLSVRVSKMLSERFLGASVGSSPVVASAWDWLSLHGPCIHKDAVAGLYRMDLGTLPGGSVGPP